MTSKQGVFHDYDLEANTEPSARNQSCIVCGMNPAAYQWSDLSGEGMCMQCGTPYQLKWGSKEQEKEERYPYLNLKKEWVPIVREYFQQTKVFTYLGEMFGNPSPSGLKEFFDWVDKNHPEMRKAEKGESEGKG